VKNNLPWTGERLVTEIANEDTVYHLHRYAIPMDYITGKIVVDIASGEGYGSNLMAVKAKLVYGIDISEEAILFATEKYNTTTNLNFRVGTVENIPLDDHIADVLVSFETLEHTGKHHEMISEIKRVLKPDGIVIISSPDKANYSDRYNRVNPFHVKELYFTEFKDLLNKYFKKSHFYYQTFVTGSLIMKDNYTSHAITEYSGNFLSVTEHQGLKYPMFNVSVSSDELFKEPQTSFFNGEDIMRNLYFNRVMSFTPYRLGNAILKPLRVFKNLFKRF
jgi:2-polyprenyl-3-methyl-5-hydroxy-6-metoxy-1,4-benzoquinol methylase